MEARAGELKLNSHPDPLNEDNLDPSDLPEMAEAQDLEAAPELQRVPSLPSTPWTSERVFYRGLATGTVLLSPLFAFFAYQPIAETLALILQEFGEEDRGWASILFTIQAVYYTATYFFGDPPFLNSVEESEKLLKANALEEKETDDCAWLFAHFNKALAFPSFAHFAADNALAIAGLASNNPAIYLSLGIPFTLFSIVHQHIVTKRDIEVHSHRFVKTVGSIFTRESIMLRLARSPLIALEVGVEASCYIAYYGIGAGYIADQLAKVIGLQETDPEVLPWVLSATVVTAYITAFSKTLTPYDTYFNPLFETLTAEDLRGITLSFTTHLRNGGIALTRAAALGWLTCRFGPEDPFEKSFLTGSICLIAFAHPFHVLYQREKREAALMRRRLRDIFHFVNQEMLAEETKPTSEKLFDKLTQRLETPASKKAVTVINVSARIGQLLAFVGFVTDILEMMNANGYSLALNFKDTVALALLWGFPIAIIDGKTNHDPLVHSLAYHRAKFLIGAPTEALAKANIVTRVTATFFYSKGQFAKTRLREALRKLDYGEEAEMEPLRHEF